MKELTPEINEAIQKEIRETLGVEPDVKEIPLDLVMKYNDEILWIVDKHLKGLA